MNKVTVIIPVYNALDYLKECVESIYKSTDLKDFDLLIADDCSPDPEVKKYLSTLKKTNLKVHFNKENLGFVGNCNNAMKLAGKADVLLLNSDTEVTKNWIKKIQVAAYSNKKIATVTPLSNNATIASVPVPFQDNALPNGYNKDSMNELVEKLSLKLYPEIPTGVGFCFYIKREALNDIGYFDQDSFKKGYGEENDFCQRAIKKGWTNIIDDTTFIYHKGHASFTNENAEPKENMQKLLNKHPNYLNDVGKYSLNNPLNDFYNLISTATEFSAYTKSKNILFIKHADISEGGGTTKHLKSLIQNLTEYNFVLLYPALDNAIFLETYIKGSLTKRLKIGIDKSDLKKVDSLIKAIAIVFDIKLVHFHHLMNWDINILDSLKGTGIKEIITFHDLYLTNGSGDFFLNPTRENLSVRDDEYKKKFQNLINTKEIAFFPSKFIKDHFVKNFDLKLKSLVIEHGTALTKIKNKEINLDKKINIAFLGIPAKSKGVETYFKLIQDNKSRFNFYIIGTKEHGFYDAVKNFDIKEHIDYKVIPYQNSNPQKELLENNIDLVVMPTKVPESFSYTLSEALQTGIPVIGYNAGAVAQRIKDLDGGWIFEDYSDLQNIIDSIDKDRSILKNKIDKVAKIKVPSIEEMLLEYKKIYKDLFENIAEIKIENNSEFDEYKLTIAKGVDALGVNPESIPTNDSLAHKIKKEIINFPVIGKPIYKAYLKSFKS